MVSRKLLLTIIFVSAISGGCAKNEEARLRAYLPNKGEAYKYCAYTSKNQEKHWDDLEENEVEVYEMVVTALVTSGISYPDEVVLERQAFTPYREEPFISQERMRLRKDRITFHPEGGIMLKSPIKLKNKWNVMGWKIDSAPGSKEETFKIKCEITSMNNDLIFGKEVNTVEVTCSPKDKSLGKTKYKMATGLGMVQVVSENEEGIIVMKEELCWDQSMSHLNLQPPGTTLPLSPRNVEVLMPDGTWVPEGTVPPKNLQ